ncbi:DNA ligase D [Geothrix sp. 21YS21S-4]|uniref:DNA ligase D n=1 Tax=Geothrix sp. 21YS21S-4 TaxID=3068889 RepID=UPI0027BAE47C|nr:DNA ligase D [Geothrix sp. 21YS21S-4]
MAAGNLARYQAKRNFAVTPEPQEGGEPHPAALQFVIQKHWARRLHYDFRLELEGTMKSWAVPRGPSYDPADKRMAVHVEDHPISYNRFEGVIPPRQYGAGRVIIWDRGVWVPVGDPAEGYRAGKLKFELWGHKLRGRWTLVRMRARDERQDAWLLIKERDGLERKAGDFSVVDELPDSVARLPPPPSPTKRPHSAIAAEVPTAPRKRLPEALAPMLATLVDRPPDDPDAWIFEIKFDGYRILARISGGKARLFTRRGHDWTARLPHLVKALEALRLKPGWLDGEIVIQDEQGRTDFQALQNAFEAERTGRIAYHLFDLPHYDARDLTGVPLAQRRELLGSLLRDATFPLGFSGTFEAPPAQLVASACRLGLEGVIGKRRDGAYVSGRSREWIKLKCSQRQEFVIGGWTDPQGSRQGFGSLLLGVHAPGGDLTYVGRVGAGFTAASLAHLRTELQKLAVARRPFAGPTEQESRAHWVKPRLIAEVSFSSWTRTGRIRQGVFHGLRDDKPPAAIVREAPQVALGPDAEEPLPARLRVSHPERVIDRATGITKLEVVRHYARVGELMMAHLAHRPAAMLRAPQGVGRPTFFQKHFEEEPLDGWIKLDPALEPDHAPWAEIAGPEGLLSAAQMNVVEFHTWNALSTRIDRPDRMTFDLDPGAGVAWEAIREGAVLVKTLLEELGLVPFVKTSGGKGLHVVVPIRRLHGWEAVKGFSRAIVQHLAVTLPALFVAKSGAKNRVGKIFVDYLRNGFGATTVCAWSARARPGLGVSVPITWDELPALEGAAHWTIRNVDARLAVGDAPWKAYGSAARGLSAAMKRLGYRPPAEEE